jgi:transmembrane sensor
MTCSVEIKMSDQMWTTLGDEVEPGWTPERERAVRAAIARRASRQRTVLRTAVAVASTGLIAVGGFALVSWRSAVPVSAPLVSGASTALRAPAARGYVGIETVTVTQLSPDTVLAPLPDRDGRGFALRAGGARFSVPHDSRRPFVVFAGDVTIEDLGTTFTVRYVAADRLNIGVEEGRVRVRAGGTDTEVPAGATLEVPVSPLAEAAPKQQRPAGVVTSSWRPLAERGQYDEARKALRKAGPSAVRDDTADLLLAADAARLSGHPAEAVPYLQRVLRGHTHDPRAGLAAFTLGRVLLDELGRPGEAVDAFAFVRSSGGPLAEDALARQVEAVSRAGDVTRSRELALLYRRLYPNGRRMKAVSRFGGLD